MLFQRISVKLTLETRNTTGQENVGYEAIGVLVFYGLTFKQTGTENMRNAAECERMTRTAIQC